jgi:signal transduction histidine kinase
MTKVSLERGFAGRMAILSAAAGLLVAASPLFALAFGQAGPPPLWVLLTMGALGASAAAALFLFPTRFVRRQAAEMSGTVTQLKAAQVKQREVNQDLTEWMASAVRKVRDLSERLVKTQEEERGRIARDLHDSVGQALAALHLELEMVSDRPEEARTLTERCLRECENALAELRRVVYDLRPPELTTSADVAEVLRSYTERFELRTRLPISFRSSGGPVRSEEVSTCLLRVLQEALTNVSRHAEAHEVGVTLTIVPGRVSMEVTDDGRGFDVQAPRRGTGLRGIHERCAFLGGSVEVDSGAQSGTRLCVNLPLAGSTS